MSDITYEELTRIHDHHVDEFSTGIYPMSDITYEELTRFGQELLFIYCSVIVSDITYEELTLAVPSPAYKSHHYQILVGHYL